VKFRRRRTGKAGFHWVNKVKNKDFFMKFTKLFRTFKEGFTNFWRNGWLSVAAISIITISLYIIGFTILIGLTTNLVLKNVQDKVNIAVYFNTDVDEKSILEIKDKLAVYSEIKSIDYVSKEQALKEFTGLIGEDSSIQNALKEIGDNPLLASLVISANKSDQYEAISKAIDSSNFKEKIDHIDYSRNKTNIDRLNGVTKIVEKAGIVLGIIFVILAILITFNTIRMTMYSHKKEFEIMRLVGASNIYVEMPFIFEGVFYGIFSAITAGILLLITAKYISQISKDDMMSFYLSNFWLILGIIIVMGVVTGVISSLIAIRKYLKT
jgi:cell division transport system permease protein